jgi:hypothetical protein
MQSYPTVLLGNIKLGSKMRVYYKNYKNSHLHPSPIFAGRPKYYLIGVFQLYGWLHDTQHKDIQHNNKKMAHSAYRYSE